MWFRSDTARCRSCSLAEPPYCSSPSSKHHYSLFLCHFPACCVKSTDIQKKKKNTSPLDVLLAGGWVVNLTSDLTYLALKAATVQPEWTRALCVFTNKIQMWCCDFPVCVATKIPSPSLPQDTSYRHVKKHPAALRPSLLPSCTPTAKQTAWSPEGTHTVGSVNPKKKWEEKKIYIRKTIFVENKMNSL